jgi:threonine dehydratase
MSVQLNDVQAARAAIASYVRRTPVIEARPVKNKISDASLYLKLELLQITGSFKARGAVNKLLSLPPEQVDRGVVTASGGNHGLGVAYAGWIAKKPATIFLGHNTPKIKAQKLAQWGAKAIFEGAVWDDANRAALKLAEEQGLAYFHPFADPAVIAAQGTIALEILEDVPDLDVILVAIGGGGLISGVSLAAKALKPSIKIIGVEPVGAPTLYESLQAGKVIELPKIQTAANTLAPRMSAEINFDIIKQNVDEILLLTDEEMHAGAVWLWEEMGIAAEMSGAAALAAIHAAKTRFDASQKVCALVCGVGEEGLH